MGTSVLQKIYLKKNTSHTRWLIILKGIKTFQASLNSQPSLTHKGILINFGISSQIPWDCKKKLSSFSDNFKLSSW